MATVGMGAYAQAVHDFIDGIRTYDADAAVAALADDADFESPWNTGQLTGVDAIKPVLEALVSDPKSRPSFTITDLSGDGHVTTVKLSVSHRFGAAPERHTVRILHLKGKIHQVHWTR